MMRWGVLSCLILTLCQWLKQSISIFSLILIPVFPQQHTRFLSSILSTNNDITKAFQRRSYVRHCCYQSPSILCIKPQTSRPWRTRIFITWAQQWFVMLGEISSQHACVLEIMLPGRILSICFELGSFWCVAAISWTWVSMERLGRMPSRKHDMLAWKLEVCCSIHRTLESWKQELLGKDIIYESMNKDKWKNKNIKSLK